MVPLCLLLLPAAITWGMEVFNNQDIHNPKFTSFVAPEDADTLQWMRKNVPGRSVVQYFGTGKGYLGEYVSEVPAIAERSVFLGDKNFTVIFQTSKEVVDQRTNELWNLFHEEAPAGVYNSCLRLGIDYFFLSTQTNIVAYDFRQELVEPYFSTVHRSGDSIVVRRNSGLSVDAKEMDRTVLLAEEGKAVLQATFERNLFPREVRQGIDTGRWMSNHAQISLLSSRGSAGQLEFTALPLGKQRVIEIFLNDQVVLRKPVSTKGSKIIFPLNLQPGLSKLRIDCPTGAEPADNYSHNGDQRKLSIRLFRFHFTNDGHAAIIGEVVADHPKTVIL